MFVQSESVFNVVFQGSHVATYEEHSAGGGHEAPRLFGDREGVLDQNSLSDIVQDFETMDEFRCVLWEV